MQTSNQANGHHSEKVSSSVLIKPAQTWLFAHGRVSVRANLRQGKTRLLVIFVRYWQKGFHGERQKTGTKQNTHAIDDNCCFWPHILQCTFIRITMSTRAVKANKSPRSRSITPTVTGPPLPLLIIPRPLIKPLKCYIANWLNTTLKRPGWELNFSLLKCRIILTFMMTNLILCSKPDHYLCNGLK